MDSRGQDTQNPVAPAGHCNGSSAPYGSPLTTAMGLLPPIGPH